MAPAKQFPSPEVHDRPQSRVLRHKPQMARAEFPRAEDGKSILELDLLEEVAFQGGRGRLCDALPDVVAEVEYTVLVLAGFGNVKITPKERHEEGVEYVVYELVE